MLADRLNILTFVLILKFHSYLTIYVVNFKHSRLQAYWPRDNWFCHSVCMFTVSVCHCALSWIIYRHAGSTSDGLLAALDANTVGQCGSECYMYLGCVCFGFSQSTSMCYLYDETLYNSTLPGPSPADYVKYYGRKCIRTFKNNYSCNRAE